MKKLFLIATALAALVSCTSDDFTGETPRPTQNGEGVISFNSTAKTITRGTAADALLLNNEFIFAGTKDEGASSFVFDQYTAKFEDNTAYSTESNSSNWEYVGYTPASTNTIIAGSGTTTQTIKYWDYATTQYDFAAYSLGVGTGTPATYATASAIAADDKEFTLTGSADQLKACYISNLVTAYNRNGVSDYGKPVQFVFRSLATKIRIAFYETIPGYAVKEVLFYSEAYDKDANPQPTPTPTPTLFTSTAVLPSGSGTMRITYPTTGWGNQSKTDYNKAHVSFEKASNNDVASTVTFGILANYANAENLEGTATTGWLGRASNTATYADGLTNPQDANSEANPKGTYYTVLPNEDGANLLLRIKYKMVSTDGSGETITVDNATAVVPAEFAQWQPNYAYTYIFKISDMTNGSTGTDGDGNIITGLTPITLDAVVVDSEDGVQETITTVSNPSITTYTQGKVVTNFDEYITSAPIYVIVNNGTSNVELTVGTNAKLFTATIQNDALQTISEASVDNALAHGTYDATAKTYTVTDANGKTLVLTDTESTLLTSVSKIEAADSPTGNEIAVDGAKFTPTAAGNYVFQYIEDVENSKYTAETAATYNATLPGAITTTGTGYSFTSYADNTGTTQYGSGKVKVVSTANGWTTVLVISNTVDGFVGKQYKVHAETLDTNVYYQLYSTDGVAQPIYVKVATYTIVADDVNAYNATLPGAVKANDMIPEKYHYKVIKVQ